MLVSILALALLARTAGSLRLHMAITSGTIIGNGRIGNMLFEKNDRKDVLIGRSDNYAEKLPDQGPIYVSTRNKDLEDIIESTPGHRRQDLVFLQNGILTDYLSKKGLQDNTQALLYVAVAKKGEEPTDGPEGYTSVTGKWGMDFKERMNKANLFCQVLDKEAWFIKMLEKHIWICAFMAVGAKHGVNVGTVEASHQVEVQALIEEMVTAAEKATQVKFPQGVIDRLCIYARSVAHFPTALKEFEVLVLCILSPLLYFQWRNGWFLDLTFKAIANGELDPCPLHTDILLRSKEVSVLDAFNAWRAANPEADSAGRLSMWIVLNSKKYVSA